jgi:hypothetical protein
MPTDEDRGNFEAASEIATNLLEAIRDRSLHSVEGAVTEPEISKAGHSCHRSTQQPQEYLNEN